MDWKKVKFVKNGYYDLLTKENYEETYILDSNIVMHLRNLFYTPDKMSDEEVNGLMNLVAFLHEKKVVTSVAVQELSWDVMTLSIDPIKFQRLEEAMNSLFLNPHEKIRIFNKIPYEGKIAPVKGSKREIASLYENSLRNNAVVPTLAILLKFQELILIYDIHQDYKLIYTKLCAFMATELELVGAYELYLFQYILFSKNDRVTEIKKLLKLDNNKDSYKKNLWNASWDILFMRSITALAVRKLRGEPTDNMENLILVTMDENLNKLTSFLISNMKTKHINGKEYPGLVYVPDDKEEDNLILASMLTLDMTAKQRLVKHNNVPLHKRIKDFESIIKATEENINNLLIRKFKQ